MHDPAFSCAKSSWIVATVGAVYVATMGKRKGKAVKNVDAQPIKRVRQEQENDSTLNSAFSSSSSSSSYAYPSRLLHTPVAHTLYDVLTDMPADLINIVSTYKQFEAADGECGWQEAKGLWHTDLCQGRWELSRRHALGIRIEISSLNS
jgi:hypothetical protein